MPIDELEPDVRTMIAATADALGTDPSTLVRSMFATALGLPRIPSRTEERGPVAEKPGGDRSPHPPEAAAAPRLRDRDLTPQAQFRPFIATALLDLGGRARLEEVVQRVHDAMEDQLTDDDHDPIPSGTEPRWRNATRWERMSMVDEGLLKDDSPAGIWELTESGREYATRQRS